MWLVLAEIIIIFIIIIIKLIFRHMDNKRIDKILDFFDNHMANNEHTDKFSECVDIIKRNSKNIQ